MRNLSITAWCTVSTEEYELLEYTSKNLVQHPVLLSFVVIVTGLKRPGNFGSLSELSTKYVEIHRPFGDGYDLSEDEGGYDQISARNFGLEVARETGGDYLLQFDADDFYDEALFDFMESMPAATSALALSCITLTEEGCWKQGLKKTRKLANNHVLVDPHIRCFRSSLNVRYERSVKADTLTNKSRHCHFSLPIESSIVAIQDYFLHFHLHVLLGKRYVMERSDSVDLPCAIPPSLEECLTAISPRNRL